MKELLPKEIQALKQKAQEIAHEVIAPKAQQVDENCMWPKHSFDALSKAGLLGLHVPKEFGGLEQGLLALTVISEALGEHCTSSAITYAMHCVGTAVICAKSTAHQEEHYLRAIAEGKHITTLALSEEGTGAHFYYPQTQLKLVNNQFVADGEKSFVTNGGFADSYVISTMISDQKQAKKGEFNCLILDKDADGITWQEPWKGFGMRGNASQKVQLRNVKIPKENLLGQEGDEIWYVFEIIAPYFLIGMAGSYLGVAQAAFDIAQAHLKERSYKHSRESLSQAQVLQVTLAKLWAKIQSTRGLVYQAAILGDKNDSEAACAIMSAKVEASETAVLVCNEAMTLCGGKAYAENSKLTRLLRDARASHVMAPTTQLLQTWAGRLLLGLPVL